MAHHLLTRLGLIGLVLLLFITDHHVSGTETERGLFVFPSCVKQCLTSTEDCPKAGPRCICRSAEKRSSSFLNSVLKCMSTSCPLDLLRNADDSFLDILESGCAAIDRGIDDDVLERAEEYASKLYQDKIQVPPKTTTTADKPDKDKPGKETARPTTTSSTAAANSKATTTSTSDSEQTASPSPVPTNDQDRGGEGGPITTTTAAVAVPNTPPPVPTTPPANQDQGSGGFVDDSPFGNPNRSGATGPRDQMAAAAAVMGVIAWAAILLI